MSDEAGGCTCARGRLYLRQTGIFPVRFFGRSSFLPRYAVLSPSSTGGPPRLQLYLSEAMEQLSEELILFSPLQLHCLPAEGNGGHSRFSLSAGDAPAVELAADSEEERQRWMFSLGESVCTPPISPATSPGSSSGTGSPTSTRKADALKAEMLGSPVLASPSIFSSFVGSSSSDLSGRVQLGRSRVADNYSMGKVFAQGDDYMVVEGLHLATHRSHALKLLSKQSPRFRSSRDRGGRGLGPRVCCRLLAQCIEEVYEGPNHVAMVMHWGTHELDCHHDLSIAVLEALRLLRELLPPEELPPEGLMLGAADTQKLMARLFALDSHLQANLFI